MSMSAARPPVARQRHGSAAPAPAPSDLATLSVVVFGATGDLARRKLLPAVQRLAAVHGPDTSVKLLGVGRSDLGRSGFLGIVGPQLSETLEVDYLGGGYDDAATYARIAQRLAAAPFADTGPALFYVATPPGVFPAIAENLGRLCAHLRRAGRPCRVLVEKPVGHDHASAASLLAALGRSLAEGEVLLVDHYLAKPAVRQLEQLRAHGVLRRWDTSSVAAIHVTVAETLGVAGRGSFYDGSGALRDVVQNHGLQLCATVLSEPPGEGAGWARRRLHALEHLSVDVDSSGSPAAVRGQYGAAPRSLARAYADEPGVRDGSRTETYAALRLRSSDPRWAGVPVYLRTGKRLAAAVGEIRVVLRGGAAPCGWRDVIRVDLRAEPYVSLLPGDGGPPHALATAGGALPSDYEHLLHSAVVGGDDVYPLPAEVLRSWEIVEPVLQAWQRDVAGPAVYPVGSWGPVSADRVLGDRAPGCLPHDGQSSARADAVVQK